MEIEVTTTASIAAKLRNKVATEVSDSNKWSEAVLGMQPVTYVNIFKTKTDGRRQVQHFCQLLSMRNLRY